LGDTSASFLIIDRSRAGVALIDSTEQRRQSGQDSQTKNTEKIIK